MEAGTNPGQPAHTLPAAKHPVSCRQRHKQRPRRRCQAQSCPAAACRLPYHSSQPQRGAPVRRGCSRAGPTRGPAAACGACPWLRPPAAARARTRAGPPARRVLAAGRVEVWFGGEEAGVSGRRAGAAAERRSSVRRRRFCVPLREAAAGWPQAPTASAATGQGPWHAVHALTWRLRLLGAR